MKRIKLLGKISALIIMTGLAFCTLTSQAEEISAKSRITEAVVTEDKQNVQIKAENSSDMQGTDGKYYLFELKAYENEIGARTDYIQALEPGNANAVFSLNYNTDSDRLYSSFVMAVYDGSKYVAVSEPRYITNPEAVAKNTSPFNDPLTKKGLNIEINMLADAFKLGIKHVATNIGREIGRASCRERV